MTLQRKLILAYSGAFSIILIIFGVVVTLYNADLAEQKNKANGERFVETNMKLLDYHFNQILNISNIITGDTDILSAIEEYDLTIPTINHVKQRMVSDKIQKLNFFKIITNTIIIGTNNKPLYYYNIGSPKVDFDFGTCEWFSTARFKVSRSQRSIFTNYHDTKYLIRPRDESTVSLISAIYDPNTYIGDPIAYLLCDFDLGSILPRGTDKSQVQMVIYDEMKAVYQNENMLSKEQNSEFLQRLFLVISGSGTEEFPLAAKGPGDSSYLVYSKLSNASSWRIIGMVVMEDSQKPIFYFAIAVIIFAIITTVILAVILSKSVLLPLNSLVKKYKEIGEGNFDVTFGKTGMVELDQLAQTSQQMVENISRLSQNIVDEQSKLAKEQIKALQHQINPHFLNNVLQSIKAMAVCGDMESISTIATLLGKVLSYAIYNPYDMVYLQKELQYVLNYVLIQDIRSDGLISYEIECGEEYNRLKVPKLMIQPIVENAFTHGFQTRTPLTISTKVFASEDALLIKVSNDGTSMEQADIDALNEKLSQNESPDEKSNSIGLLNVNQRIKKIYGMDFGLRMEGLVKGLAVIVSLPINTIKGDEDNA